MLRPGWRDLAGRQWHARRPAASRRRQPTRHPRRAHSAALIHGRVRWLRSLPLGALRHASRSTVPPLHGDGQHHPARQQRRQQHGQDKRDACRQPHRRPRPALHDRRDRQGDVPGGGVESGPRREGWRDGEPAFYSVVVWRDQAEHAAESLRKGSRVVVVGRLAQRSWQADDGATRSVVEVVADELGPSLWWATATSTRATRSPSG
jgi:hypothetical protein